MYKRINKLYDFISHKSIFLLGPRQTGKSTLLRKHFEQARYIDLLESDTFRKYSANPEILRQELTNKDSVIIIDEVQKLPSLLDEVQLLIDRNRELRFILTGSSARKLKRGKANLLGGRALFFNLFPLVTDEYGFDKIDQAINTGSLPAIIDSPLYKEDLKSYVGTYLKEEILAEAVTRNIEGFSRFINTAGLSNSQLINYTKIGNDAQISPRIVREYFQILEDTLIADQLPAYLKTQKRKAMASSKLYFFDLGVANLLMKRNNIEKGSAEYGMSLEHLIFLELKAYINYKRKEQSLCYWRSLSQLEVDFIIGDEIAIEVKAGRVSKNDLKGIKAFKEDINIRKAYIICNEENRRTIEEYIYIIPVKEFLEELWNDRIF